MSRPGQSNEASPLLGDHSRTSVATEQGASQAESETMNARLIFKIAAAMYSFATLGLFNSSIGAVLPLLSQHYNLSDIQVSSIFLAGPIGYVLAAQFSDAVHYRFGQRGIAFAGPILQVIATATVAAHPGFGLILVAFAFQGLGTGLLDGSWCAWAGSMQKANTISGLLHGSFSVGAALGPLLLTVLTAKHQDWWTWYSILAGACALSFIVQVAAFRHESASVYRQSKQSKMSDSKVHLREIFKHPATWLCAAFFLTYVGVETSISGWVVSFMLRERHASDYVAGLSSSGYWIGMAIGRLVLGFATDRMGVRRATTLYFLFAIVFEALFAVFSSLEASVIFMTATGFVHGPLFPSGVVVLTRLLPAELHVAVVSFVASLGQIGGAFLPFAIGAVVQGLGIGVFRFAILVETLLALLVWLAFARLRPALLPISAAHTQD
ncbi:MFS transporter-like protein [Bipolaris maydis]|nr:MFS transporter-like protein [Bipolaris maydis]